MPKNNISSYSSLLEKTTFNGTSEINGFEIEEEFFNVYCFSCTDGFKYNEEDKSCKACPSSMRNCKSYKRFKMFVVKKNYLFILNIKDCNY